MPDGNKTASHEKTKSIPYFARSNKLLAINQSAKQIVGCKQWITLSLSSAELLAEKDKSIKLMFIHVEYEAKAKAKGNLKIKIFVENYFVSAKCCEYKSLHNKNVSRLE